LLSLSLPFFAQAKNAWLFKGSSDPAEKAIESNVASSPEIAMAPFHEEHKAKSASSCKKKNWECAIMVGSGYRHDRLSHRYTPSSTSTLQRVKFKYRDVDSVMGLVRFDARVSNLLFNIEGDYSPVVSGTLSAPFNIDPEVSSVFNFRFKKLTGYEADAMTSIGYRLPFMNGYRSRAAIIVQVGYRYSHQTYETDAQSKTSNGNFISILQDQAPSHTEWFGPFVEGRVSFSYLDRYYFQPFYQYHFLDYRSRRHEAQMVFNYTAGSPPVPTEFLVKFLSNGDDARGQLGGIDFYYQPKTNHLRLGLKGTYLDFESRETKTRTKIKRISLNTNPSTSTTSKAKYHSHGNWQSYSIAAYAGYSF
jgi:hypothetical protein